MKEIQLTQGKVALVDDEDYNMLVARHWFVTENGYAYCRQRRGQRPRIISMHRLVCPSLEDVDHINGNKLDNQKSNLRPCTRSQNMARVGKRSVNTSGYKGVHLCPSTGRWRAIITVDYKQKTIGRYDTPEDAARAYNEVAKSAFGEFAYLNPV